MTNKCLNEGTLQSFADRQLNTEEMKSASFHLQNCAVCQSILKDLKQADEWLLPIMGRDSFLITNNLDFRPLVLLDIRASIHPGVIMTIMSIAVTLLACLAGFYLWSPLMAPINTNLIPLATKSILDNSWNLVLTMGIHSTYLNQLHIGLMNAAAFWTILFTTLLGWQISYRQKLFSRKLDLN